MFPRRKASSERIFQRTAVVECSRRRDTLIKFFIHQSLGQSPETHTGITFGDREGRSFICNDTSTLKRILPTRSVPVKTNIPDENPRPLGVPLVLNWREWPWERSPGNQENHGKTENKHGGHRWSWWWSSCLRLFNYAGFPSVSTVLCCGSASLSPTAGIHNGPNSYESLPDPR